MTVAVESDRRHMVSIPTRVLHYAAVGLLAVQPVCSVRNAHAANMASLDCFQNGYRLGSAINSLPAEPWSSDERLVYDALATSSSITQLTQPELDKFRDDLLMAQSRLGVAFPETLRSVVRLEYETTRLVVHFSDSVQQTINARGPRTNFPVPFSERLEAVCRELCQCWIEPARDVDRTNHVYFGRGTNLLFAARGLRTVPEVIAAGLSRGVYYQPDYGREADPSQRLSARITSGGFLFQLSTTGTAAAPGSTYYEVTVERVHRLSAAEVTKRKIAKLFAIPDDAWAPPTEPRDTTIPCSPTTGASSIRR